MLLCKTEMKNHSRTNSMQVHLKRKHPGALLPQNVGDVTHFVINMAAFIQHSVFYELP